MTTVELDAIKIGNRHRRDLGDIDALAASIEDVGLLQLPVVTTDLILVAGERRLAALRKLGRAETPVHQVSNLSDAESLLRAERDENTCRKAMSPSEKVALAEALRDLKREEAKQRQREGGARGGRAEGSENFTEPSGGKNEVRDQLGGLVGMSGVTYSRAREVVKALDHEDPDVRRIAEQARDEMDSTGKVSPAYDKVAQVTGRRPHVEPKPVETDAISKSKLANAVRWDKIRELAAGGHSSSQIAKELGYASAESLRETARRQGIEILADRVVGRARRIDSTRVARQTVFAVEAAATGLNLINYADVDRSEAADWATSLNESMAELRRFHTQIKEMTQ